MSLVRLPHTLGVLGSPSPVPYSHHRHTPPPLHATISPPHAPPLLPSQPVRPARPRSLTTRPNAAPHTLPTHVPCPPAPTPLTLTVAAPLFSCQVGTVFFATHLLDLVALAAFWVLQNPAPAAAPAAASAAVVDEEVADIARRHLWWVHQYLSLRPDDSTEGNLYADLADSFSGVGGVSYDRSYFVVAFLCVVLSIAVCAMAGVSSAGFKSLSAGQQRMFVLLSPFGLQTLYTGVLYASNLKKAVSEKEMERAHDRHGIIVMLMMLQATFASIPLVLLSATAIAKSDHPRLLVAVLAGSAVSMAYAFFGYACEICAKELRKHARGRPQLFAGILIHCLWEVAAITTLLAAAKIGPWRFIAVPLLLLLGFVQLAPAVLGLSSNPDKQSNLAGALVAMSPLACLSSVIDGPLLGFGTHHADDGTFTAADLDRAVAWRRRFVLFLCAFIALFVDLVAGGSKALETFAHPWGVHHDDDWKDKLRTNLDVVEDDIMLIGNDFFQASGWWLFKFFLLMLLFIADAFASSRAWRVAGYSPIEEDDMLMGCMRNLKWMRSKMTWLDRPNAYAQIAPAVEPPSALVTLLNTEHAALKGYDNQFKATDEQVRLHDALEALQLNARSFLDSRQGVLPPKPPAGASEATVAAYEAAVAEVVAARAEAQALRHAAAAQRNAALAALDDASAYESPPPTTDPMVMAERMEAATMEMISKFYRMPPAEVSPNHVSPLASRLSPTTSLSPLAHHVSSPLTRMMTSPVTHSLRWPSRRPRSPITRRHHTRTRTPSTSAPSCP